MKTLAVIPARRDSKGLPHKHLLPLSGKPVIAWTIEAALQSEHVDSVIVSSDSPMVLEVAHRYRVQALHRPPSLARDNTPSEPVVEHALLHAVLDPDVTVLLQPTSPLRTARDIDGALTVMSARQSDAVISVFEPPHSPWKCFFETDEGHLRGVVSDEAPFKPRQSFPRALMPNGAIYGIETALFRATGRLFGSKTVPYLMPYERSIDIDAPEDLKEARRLLRSTRRAA